jgi:hypothetical protein
MLKNYGAEVRACASAAEALKTLDEWRPDVLVPSGDIWGQKQHGICNPTSNGTSSGKYCPKCSPSGLAHQATEGEHYSAIQSLQMDSRNAQSCSGLTGKTRGLPFVIYS